VSRLATEEMATQVVDFLVGRSFDERQVLQL
jgi:hypothetical protein